MRARPGLRGLGQALSPRRERLEAVGPPPAPIREAAASGSARRSPRLVAGPEGLL